MSEPYNPRGFCVFQQFLLFLMFVCCFSLWTLWLFFSLLFSRLLPGRVQSLSLLIGWGNRVTKWWASDWWMASCWHDNQHVCDGVLIQLWLCLMRALCFSSLTKWTDGFLTRFNIYWRLALCSAFVWSVCSWSAAAHLLTQAINEQLIPRWRVSSLKPKLIIPV